MKTEKTITEKTIAPKRGKNRKSTVARTGDVQIEHLETLVRIRRADSGEKSRALSEPSPRSLADASRDLQRAIELFLKLEKKGL